MSNSTPSLLALLGLAAAAGYQNRDKISEMVSDARQAQPTSTTTAPAEGFLSQIGHLFQPATGAATLSGGLSELVNRFTAAGHAPATNSWVAHGPNMPIQESQLEAVLGEDILNELEQKTGLPRRKLVRRLGRSLPDVVNRFTPSGRLPSTGEAQVFV